MTYGCNSIAVRLVCSIMQHFKFDCCIVILYLYDRVISGEVEEGHVDPLTRIDLNNPRAVT